MSVSGQCCPERMSSDIPSGCASVKDQGIEGVNIALIWIWNMEGECISTKSTEALQNNRPNLSDLPKVTTGIQGLQFPLLCLCLRTYILEHCFHYVLFSLLTMQHAKYTTNHIAVWFFGLLRLPSVNRIV